MTIPLLREPVQYWAIAIDHEDAFNKWSIRDSDPVFVSAKGYATVRYWAQFRTEADANKFLTVNRELLEGRCGRKHGFLGFTVTRCNSLWPVTFDAPVELAKPRRQGRTRLTPGAVLHA